MSGSTASGFLHVDAESKAPYSAAELDSLTEDAAQVIARYPQKRSALLPLLHLVQSIDGYVTGRGVSFCAEQLDLTEAEVSGVATFYTQYKRHPNGTFTVGVCTNTLCAVMGGDQIFDTVSDHLGVGHDETTDDGVVTLERIECNAACDYAPVVMANWEFFDNQTPETAVRLVDDLRAGTPVKPTRGADEVVSFKAMSRVLAGFNDGRGREGVGAGPASLLGLRIAREHDWVAPGDEHESERHGDEQGSNGAPVAQPEPTTPTASTEEPTVPVVTPVAVVDVAPVPVDEVVEIVDVAPVVEVVEVVEVAEVAPVPVVDVAPVAPVAPEPGIESIEVVEVVVPEAVVPEVLEPRVAEPENIGPPVEPVVEQAQAPTVGGDGLITGMPAWRSDAPAAPTAPQYTSAQAASGRFGSAHEPDEANEATVRRSDLADAAAAAPDEPIDEADAATVQRSSLSPVVRAGQSRADSTEEPSADDSSDDARSGVDGKDDPR